MITLLPLLLGAFLDLLLGDPHWLPHPVRFMGAAIQKGEGLLRPLFPKTPGGERLAGAILTLTVTLGSAAVGWGLLRLAGSIHPLVALTVETLLTYQLLAARSLWDESMAVHRRLVADDLPGARTALSRIVGRDTQALPTREVARAAVETVAENTSDGVVAPLLFLALGGLPFGLFYKAVNTLDSMVGYKNERYLHFGRFAARLDDLCNLLPARLSAALMVLAAFILGYDGKNALRITRRDRFCHQSPNSAHTEAACAGALGIRLGGGASYFGVFTEKPTIGDPTRPIEPGDIRRANHLMAGTAALALGIALLLRFLITP